MHVSCYKLRKDLLNSKPNHVALKSPLRGLLPRQFFRGPPRIPCQHDQRPGVLGGELCPGAAKCRRMLSIQESFPRLQFRLMPRSQVFILQLQDIMNTLLTAARETLSHSCRISARREEGMAPFRPFLCLLWEAGKAPKPEGPSGGPPSAPPSRTKWPSSPCPILHKAPLLVMGKRLAGECLAGPVVQLSSLAGAAQHGLRLAAQPRPVHLEHEETLPALPGAPQGPDEAPPAPQPAPASPVRFRCRRCQAGPPRTRARDAGHVVSEGVQLRPL